MLLINEYLIPASSKAKIRFGWEKWRTNTVEFDSKVSQIYSNHQITENKIRRHDAGVPRCIVRTDIREVKIYTGMHVGETGASIFVPRLLDAHFLESNSFEGFVPYRSQPYIYVLVLFLVIEIVISDD